MLDLLLALGLLGGCPGESSKDDSAAATDSADTDTDTDSDTDADSDADTDTDSDTDTDADTDVEPEATVGLDFEDPFDGSGYALTFVDLATGLTAGDVLASGVVTGAYVSFAPPDPPETDLVEIPEVPGLYAAYYVPGQFDDADDDGERDLDEVWTGIGDTWALYLRGKIPPKLAALGLGEGWNGVAFQFDGGNPSFVDPLHLPVPTNLRPAESLVMGGAYTGSIDSDDTRLFLLPYPVILGGSVDAFLHDSGPLVGDWTIELGGEPPADHFSAIETTDLYAALEVPFAYTDVGGDSTWDPKADPLLWGACSSSGEPVAAFWIPAPTELDFALGLVINGYGTGWSVMEVGAAGLVTVPSEEWTGLTIDDDCVVF